jgi:NAD(P)-dependent dehydrogenase (short-subunit alcohol dehydrogenase family)
MRKTMLITGASSGIGKATATYFHQQDWKVITTMRTPDQEHDLTALANVLVTRLDVQEADTIQRAVAAGLARFGRIDVLVNNAGYGAIGLLEATPLEKIRRQFDVNVFGLLATTKVLLPHFRANHSGLIINISSIGGQMSFPLAALYHGTKFAVEGLSEALSFEMAAIGVRVKLVEPGAIKTDFGSRSMDFSNDDSLVEYQAFVGKVMAGFGQLLDGGADPLVVAEVIYQATTDGTDQLRYTAGDDAKVLVAHRKAADDPTFLQGIKQQFGL